MAAFDIKKMIQVDELVGYLGGLVSKERILSLSEAGIFPHVLIEGTRLYQKTTAKQWVEENLAFNCEGQEYPREFKIVNACFWSEVPKVPVELTIVAQFLMPIAMEGIGLAGTSGIYFLCDQDEIVYVGQSINVASRIGQHAAEKDFTHAFWMRIPKDDLLYVEGHFIRLLQPKYNFSSEGRLVAGRADYKSEANPISKRMIELATSK